MTTAENTVKLGGIGNPALWLVAFSITAVSLLVVYHDGLKFMTAFWGREEYSHGWLIPAIALFIAWQKAPGLVRVPWRGSWAGVAIVLSGLLFFVMGELSALYTIVQYAFLVALCGVLVSVFGREGMKYLLVPFVYLIFMIPLPNFLYFNLSADLQLISSEIGVAVIRLFGISVYLEGNVIDLGHMQLQVVDACSGLRYLFPLMSFGFLCAYLFKAPLWQRAIIFLSSIPLTVLMNSFRIGVIGVLVEHFGPEHAQGFMHYFEGWIIFMTCVAVMFALMLLFAKMSKRSFHDIFDLTIPTWKEIKGNAVSQSVPKPFVVATVILAVAAVFALSSGDREEIIPERDKLSLFPLGIDEWSGRTQPMEQEFIDVLKFDDYIVADYTNEEPNGLVNMYVAYYESQRKGASVHSPKACIPGGGWRIKEFDQVGIPGILADDQPLTVNRTLIQKGGHRQLVYYWFEQRGRKLTNEYLVKWYLFWDSVTRKRTDGALIRLTTFAPEGEDIEVAEQRLVDFLRSSYTEFSPYIPD